MSKGEEKAAKSARVVAMPARKAIMKERKRRAAMPMKERPKEMRPSTVKGIIQAIQGEMAAIQSKRMDIHIGIRAMGSSINQQAKENKEAIAAFYAGVGDLYESILVQVKENKDSAEAFFSAVQGIQSSINEKIQENMEYVKNFYG